MQDIPDDSNNTAIAHAILGLSETLGQEVVVEGRKIEAQHRFLVSEGSALGQGFLYCKPLIKLTFEEYHRNL